MTGECSSALRHQAALNWLLDLYPARAHEIVAALGQADTDGNAALGRHVITAVPVPGGTEYLIAETPCPCNCHGLTMSGICGTCCTTEEPDDDPVRTRARRIIRYAPEILDHLMHVIEVVDAFLDAAGPQWAKDCPEANMQRRVGKAQLEAAEAMEELSLLTGENPRKGQDPAARDRMLLELGDTAVAALLGIQSQTKDIAATWDVLTAALAKAESRVPR